jgi:hypothetical protein
VSLEVDVMIGVKNIATVARDEIGDAAYQTLAVGALHQEGGSSSRRLTVARHCDVFDRSQPVPARLIPSSAGRRLQPASLTRGALGFDNSQEIPMQDL